jgi:hypothetical protein
MRTLSAIITAAYFLTAYASLPAESIYIELARTRQYAGGADEADLKVQTYLKQSSKLKNRSNEQRRRVQQPASVRHEN